MWKSKFIFRSCSFFLIFGIGIGYPGPSSPPFSHFLGIPITHLHALIIETWTFAESFDDKMGFSFDPLHIKIKPSWDAIRVGLLLQLNLVGIACNQFYILQVSALKITPESHMANPNDPTQTWLYLLYIPVYLFEVHSIHRLFLEKEQTQLVTFIYFVYYLFGGFIRRRQGHLLGEVVG